METRMKSEKGEDKRFAPKFNKKKNGGKSNAAKQADRDIPELLRGVEFSVARNGPDPHRKRCKELGQTTLSSARNY